MNLLGNWFRDLWLWCSLPNKLLEVDRLKLTILLATFMQPAAAILTALRQRYRFELFRSTSPLSNGLGLDKAFELASCNFEVQPVLTRVCGRHH